MLAATGVVAGILAGLLGIGGGLVIVPALTFILRSQGVETDLAVPVAIATSLATMLLTSASAVWFHDRRAGVHWPTVARLAPGVGLGALAGAWIATLLPGLWLGRIFALLAAIIGIRMLLNLKPRPGDQALYPRAWPVAGPAIGALSAVMGIGGGSFNVPYLVRCGFAPVRAVAIASACGWPIALGGVTGFVAAGWGEHLLGWSIGYLYGPGVLVIGLFGAAAAPLGVALAHRLPADRLRRIFGLLLMLVAIRMLW